MKILLTLILVFLGYSHVSFASCQIKNSNGAMTSAKADALYLLLQQSPTCPESVQALKILFKNAGNSTRPSMVANRGIHNSNLGSFSVFEEVGEEGELFFGHFTDVVNGTLILDQKPAPRKLMVELIAWDSQKNMFNFYELIGTSTGGQWFYRGDSADILQDNANLYLNAGAPQFGKTLRCSACHTSGGPIMKEISFPYNDWWTKARPLDFGQNRLSTEVSQIVSELIGAEDFSQSVKKGIQKLENSSEFKKIKAHKPLQVQLRPLFCEMEINLESDLAPLMSGLANIQVPTASVVNPFFSQSSLEIFKSDYEVLLNLFNMNFPETENKDADHAWLVPVKGYSDLLAVQSLIQENVITAEFAADVLAVDMQNPLFSAKRCGLLKLFPKTGGIEGFIENLKISNLPGAEELVKNLTDPARNIKLYSELAENLLKSNQSQLRSQDGQRVLFEKLILQRKAVFESEISKNPLGQILEPGFRVIFPLPK
jgi:hypothetical protein